MSNEANESEIEMNKYFKILENDLKQLKKDKANQNLRKKISSNLELIPCELEYYQMFAENATGPEKTALDANVALFQQKITTLQKKYAKYTNSGVPKITAADMALNPAKIEEATGKINLCDLQRTLIRTTSIRFGGSNTQRRSCQTGTSKLGLEYQQ